MLHFTPSSSSSRIGLYGVGIGHKCGSRLGIYTKVYSAQMISPPPELDFTGWELGTSVAHVWHLYKSI